MNASRSRPKRLLMLVLGMLLLVAGGGMAVRKAIKADAGDDKGDETQAVAPAEGAKIAERDWKEEVRSFDNEMKRLNEPGLGISEKVIGTVALLEKMKGHLQHVRVVREEAEASGEVFTEPYEKGERQFWYDIRNLTSVLHDHLLEWHADAPDEAAVFASAISDEEIKAECLNALIRSVVKEDFEAALELAKLQLAKHPEAWRGNRDLCRVAANRSPEDVRRVSDVLGNWATELPDRDFKTPQDTITMEFSDDYPFREMLNVLADIEEAVPEDSYVPFTITGLMRAWSRQDPDAAYEWLMEGRKVTLNSLLSEYLRGYAESSTANPEEIGRILAEWDDRHESERSRAWAFYVTIGTGNEAVVMDAYFNGLGITGSRDGHLAETLRMIDPGLDELRDKASNPALRKGTRIILAAMSPGARMKYVVEGPRSDSLDPHILIQAFKDLGHSEADLARIQSRMADQE